MPSPRPLPFTSDGLDRAAELRGADAAAAVRADPAARVIAVGVDQSVLLDGDSRLARLPVPAAAGAEDLWLLGRDTGGAALFAVDAADTAGAAVAAVAAGGGLGRFAGLRQAGLRLEPAEASLAAYAVALVGWHRFHRHCARCGAATVVEQAGHLRSCPRCGAQHFPRTDPAVIMLVVSGRRCVLSRRPGAPDGFWSALAGFVEPGETPEAAVVREVREEVGLRVADVEYQGAQPWPFPSALMLGFRARLVSGASDELVVERSELVDARWFSRALLREELRAGRIDLPSELSLGHRIIREWVDEG